MKAPTLTQIKEARDKIDDFVVETPVWKWQNRKITEIVGEETQVFLKLELFQHTGTFKPRGALLNTLNLSQEALEKGIPPLAPGITPLRWPMRLKRWTQQLR